MERIIDFISQPWHWAVSGALIAALSVIMTLLGERFGISGFYNAICSAGGAGKRIKLFDKDYTKEFWRMCFIIGAMIGGYIALHFLSSDAPVHISESTIAHLKDWGIAYPDDVSINPGFLPTEVFNFSSTKGILLALIGGVLIGFGSRYGEGCTSGHAINGLSHLQLPSLLAVIGFFIGGLLMTHLIMPWIFG